MRANKMINGKAVSMFQGILTGVFTGAVIIVGTAVGIAKLIDFEKISWESVGYYIAIAEIIASAAGAWIACYRIKHRYLMVSVLNATCLWVFMIGITALFFGGQYNGVVLTGLLLYCGSIVVFFLSIPRQKRLRYKK